jgi:hypothetical protein
MIESFFAYQSVDIFVNDKEYAIPISIIGMKESNLSLLHLKYSREIDRDAANQVSDLRVLEPSPSSNVESEDDKMLLTDDNTVVEETNNFTIMKDNFLNRLRGIDIIGTENEAPIIALWDSMLWLHSNDISLGIKAPIVKVDGSSGVKRCKSFDSFLTRYEHSNPDAMRNLLVEANGILYIYIFNSDL